MTPQNAKELLPIITAFANGETIQFRLYDKDEWGSGSDFTFNHKSGQYRIKPAPRDFMWVINRMKEGKPVRRGTWKNGGYIAPIDGVITYFTGRAYVASVEDLEANDWEIAE